MTRPLITVLITTYNYGQFIEESIDSVFAQEFPADQIEVLVVDDGSTDDTSERVMKYGSRISYLYKPNGGQASALNLGFANAHGEIVSLLDADDFFAPTKLARIAEAFERDRSLGLVYHRAKEWNAETGESYGDHFISISGDLRQHPERLALYTPQPTTCVSFRRSVLAPLLPIPEDIRMNADCFLVALVPFLAPVLAIAEFLSVYRIHGRNSFYVEDEHVPPDVRSKRLLTWQTVIAEMRAWLAIHNYSKDSPAVRSLIERWDSLIDREAFALAPPGRVDYFRYLLRSYRHRVPLMTRRLMLLNYLDAFAALVVGYRNFPRWTKWRESLLHRVTRRQNAIPS